MSLREPRFDHDYGLGAQAEMFATDVRRGLADGRVEDKHDLQAAGTGRLYIEYECYRQGRYRPSGIQETKATYWLIALQPPHVALVISVERLRDLTDGAWREGRDFGARREECKRGSHPTKGVLVDIGRIVASCRS